MASTVVCDNCESEVTTDREFCPSCGVPVDSESSLGESDVPPGPDSSAEEDTRDSKPTPDRNAPTSEPTSGTDDNPLLLWGSTAVIGFLGFLFGVAPVFLLGGLSDLSGPALVASGAQFGGGVLLFVAAGARATRTRSDLARGTAVVGFLLGFLGLCLVFIVV